MSRRNGAAAGPMAAMEEEAAELRRGPWTLEEDNLLMSYISCHGEGRWNLLARCSGLKRTGKSCRLRWLNYLKPGIKRGNLTAGEQLVILELHAKWGNRWSRIAQHLPGRTDNDIKNYWRTWVQKQARQLKVDANSAVFRDAVRCYWMPHLLDRITTASCAAAAAPPPLMEQHGGMSSSQSPAIGSDQLCCYPAAGFDPSTMALTSGSTAAAALQPAPVPYFSELNGEDQYYYPGVGNLDGGVGALDSAALLGSLGLDGLDLGPAESYYSDSTLQDYLNYSSCTAASAMNMMMSGGSAMVVGDHHGTTTTTCQAPRRLAGE